MSNKKYSLFADKVGSVVRKHRIKAKKRCIDVCNAVGLSASHLSHIEHGRRTPTLKTFTKIAKYLRISIDEL